MEPQHQESLTARQVVELVDRTLREWIQKKVWGTITFRITVKQGRPLVVHRIQEDTHKA